MHGRKGRQLRQVYDRRALLPVSGFSVTPTVKTPCSGSTAWPYTPAARPPEHPAHGLMDKIVFVVQKFFGYREGIVETACPDKGEGGQYGDPLFPENLRFSQVVDDLLFFRVFQQPDAQNIVGTGIHRILTSSP